MKTYDDLKFIKLEEYDDDYLDGYHSYASIDLDKDRRIVVLTKYSPDIVNNKYTVKLYVNEFLDEIFRYNSTIDVTKEMLDIQGIPYSDYINELMELLEKYSKYKNDFDEHVYNVYSKFFNIAKKYGMSENNRQFPVNLKYGGIRDIIEITDNKILFSWEENWRYGGHDEGDGKIPLSWVKNTEEELKKYENECRTIREKQLNDAIDKVYEYENNVNLNRNGLFNSIIIKYSKKYNLSDISCGTNCDTGNGNKDVLLYKSSKDNKYYEFTEEMNSDYKFINEIASLKTLENEIIKADYKNLI